jgi:hypothetical protein
MRIMGTTMMQSPSNSLNLMHRCRIRVVSDSKVARISLALAMQNKDKRIGR